MPGGKGKRIERVPMSQGKVLALPKAIATSNRCRATHDVPYTLRCVLDASHAWTSVIEPQKSSTGETVTVVTKHQDKKGGTW